MSKLNGYIHECSRCSGLGSVYSERDDAHGYTIYERCVRCGGSGRCPLDAKPYNARGQASRKRLRKRNERSAAREMSKP